MVLLFVKITEFAARDLVAILKYSERAYGRVGRTRYKNLLDQAICDLAENFRRPGTHPVDPLNPDYFGYHIKWSKNRVQSEKVSRPRHFILYRLVNESTLVIARVLHERMLPTLDGESEPDPNQME